MENNVLIIHHAMRKLETLIQRSSLSVEIKEQTLESIRSVDVNLVVSICESASSPLTRGNVAYLLCFLARIDTKVIASIFLVEPSTVYTSRYRLNRRCNADRKLQI
jgi:hypothetical protein